MQNSPKERSERCLTQARDSQDVVSSQKLSLSKQGHIKRVSMGKTLAHGNMSYLSFWPVPSRFYGTY